MNTQTDRGFRIGSGIAHSAAALIALLALVPVAVGAAAGYDGRPGGAIDAEKVLVRSGPDFGAMGAH